MIFPKTSTTSEVESESLCCQISAFMKSSISTMNAKIHCDARGIYSHAFTHTWTWVTFYSSTRGPNLMLLHILQLSSFNFYKRFSTNLSFTLWEFWSICGIKHWCGRRGASSQSKVRCFRSWSKLSVDQSNWTILVLTDLLWALSQPCWTRKCLLSVVLELGSM